MASETTEEARERELVSDEKREPETGETGAAEVPGVVEAEETPGAEAVTDEAATAEAIPAEPAAADEAPPEAPITEIPETELSPTGLDLLFRSARTHNAWREEPVSDETLRELFDLLKWGPTSANCSPARFLFLRTKEAKERLRPALSAGNVTKTMLAPVTVIVAYDPKFFDLMPRLFPHDHSARSWFAGNEAFAVETAFRNGSLQGAYLIMAARALGFDCGPMSGFDRAKVDEEFFAYRGWKSNFLCNLGHGDPAGLFARSPRLDFDEACELL